MTLPKPLTDREYLKFVDTNDGPAVRTTTKVQVENVNLEAEMKVDSGHDLYEAESVTRDTDLCVRFTAIPTLTIAKVQSVENKTQGWVYNTKGATVSTDGILLLAASQSEDYPVIGASDVVEVIYRGTSRLTDKTQMAQITDGTNQATVIVQDAAFGTASKGLPMFGKYQASPTTYTDGDAAPVLLDANGRVVLSSDIEIGAVELKNGATDDRALIGDANTARAATDHVLSVQQLAADGTVPPSGSLNSNAPFSKLTDGTSDADIIVNSAAGDASTKLGVASEVADFDTSAGEDFTGAIGLLAASASGAVPVLADANGELQIDVLTLPAVSGEVTAVGKAADGAAVAGNPVLVAGQDGTNAQSIKTDSNGELQVDVLTQPALASGTDSVSAVQSGTWNITNVSGTVSLPTGAATETTLAVVSGDTTSIDATLTDVWDDANDALQVGIAGTINLPVYGTVADGSAVADAPVLIAGQDGTNVESLKTDSTGRLEVIGGAADGAAVAGNPILVAGSDGTNAETLHTDASGDLQIDVLSITAGTNMIGKITPVAGTITNTIGTINLSANPLSVTTAIGANHKVVAVMLHAASAISQTVTLTFDSGDNAIYDTVLSTEALVTATDFSWQPDSPLLMKSGSELILTCTNSGTPDVVVSATIVTETMA